MRDLLDKLKSIEETVDSNIIELGDEFGISFSEDLEISAEVVGFVEDGIVIDLDETAISHLTENGIRLFDGELTEGLRDPKDNPCWKGYKPVGTKKKGGKTVPNCVPESVNEENEAQRKLAQIGRKMMDMAASEKDDEFSNNLAKLGDALTRYGTPFGPRSVEDLIKTTGLEIKDIKAMMDAAEKRPDTLSKVKDPSPEKDVDEAEYQGRDVPLGKKMSGDVKKYKVYVRNPQGNVVKVNFGDKKMRIKKSNPARRKSFRARHNCSNPGPRHKARYWSCRNW